MDLVSDQIKIKNSSDKKLPVIIGDDLHTEELQPAQVLMIAVYATPEKKITDIFEVIYGTDRVTVHLLYEPKGAFQLHLYVDDKWLKGYNI